MKIKILFLCTGNSCRSQMAEGWARHLKGDEIRAFVAGLPVVAGRRVHGHHDPRGQSDRPILA